MIKNLLKTTPLFLLFVSVFLVSAKLPAQSAYTTFYENGWSFARGVSPAPNNGFYLWGNTDHFGTLDPALMYLDSSGHTVRTQAQVNATDDFQAIASTPFPGGGLVTATEIYGYQTTVRRLDGSGNVLWTRSLQFGRGNSLIAAKLRALSSGNIALLMTDNASSYFFIYSPTGNLLVQRYLPARLRDICEFNGELYFAGSDASGNNSRILRTDLSGTPIRLYQGNIFDELYAISPSLDGNLVAAGRLYGSTKGVVKITPNAGVVWTRSWTHSSSLSFEINGVHAPDPNTILITAVVGVSSNYNAGLYRLNASGIIQGSAGSINSVTIDQILGTDLQQVRPGQWAWAFRNFLEVLDSNYAFCGAYSAASITESAEFEGFGSISISSSPNFNPTPASHEWRSYEVPISSNLACGAPLCQNFRNLGIKADLGSNVCQGRPLQFSLANPSNLTFHRWFLNGNPLGTAATQEITFNQPGSYKVEAEFEVASNCFQRAQMWIQVDTCDMTQPPSLKTMRYPEGTNGFHKLAKIPAGGYAGVQFHLGSVGQNDSIFVMRLDDEGNMLWDTHLNFGFNYAQLARWFAVKPNGNLLVIGYGGNSNNSDIYFLEFDTNGNFIGETNWQEPSNSLSILDVLQDPLGEIYICGRLFVGPNNGPTYLAKFTPNAQPIWFKTYPQIQTNSTTLNQFYFSYLNFANNGEILVGGSDNIVARLDTAGNMLKMNLLKNGRGFGQFRGIYETPNGDLNLIAATPASGDDYQVMARITPRGTPLVHRYLRNSDILVSSTQGLSGEIIFQSNEAVSAAPPDTLRKIDSWGHPLRQAYVNFQGNGTTQGGPFSSGSILEDNGSIIFARGNLWKRLDYNLNACDSSSKAFTWQKIGLDFDTLVSYVQNPASLIPTTLANYNDSLFTPQSETICVSCPAFGSFAVSDTTPCPNQTIQFTPAIGGSPSYEWYVNGQLFSTAFNPSRSFSSNGTYTIELKAFGGTCRDSSTVVVTVNATSYSAGQDQSVCLGDSAQLNVNGGISFAWSPAAGLSSTSVGNPKAAPGATTDYVVSVSDASGCTSTDTVRVTVNPLPLANAGPDQGTCGGNSATLSGSASGGTPGYGYFWSTGANTQTTTVTPTSSTTYTLTVTDANGCSGIDQITITPSPAPTASAGNDQSICSGSSASLSAAASGGTPGYSYTWSSGANTQNTSVSPVNTTTYTLTVTDANGCISSDQVTVTVTQAPTASAGNDQSICSGSSASLSAAASGGTPGYSYTWSSGANTQNTSVSPISTTTYTLTVTDANGCTATDQVTVTVTAAPFANAGSDQNICFGELANLSGAASGGSGNLSYTWQPGNLSGANQSVSPGITTLYILEVTDTNGCIGRDSMLVMVNLRPLVNLGGDQDLCPGTSVGLAANTTSGTAPFTFAWSTGGSGTQIQVSPVITTSYSVTVTDANGCEGADTVTINTFTPPSSDFSFMVVSGTTYDFTDQSNGNPVSWIWEFGDGNTSTQQNPQHTYAVIDTYTVCLRITDASGCRDTICKVLPPDPTAIADPLPAQIHVWPNPSTDRFQWSVQLHRPELLHLRLFDARGKLIRQEHFPRNAQFQGQIDLSNFSKGLYFLEISGENWQHSQKLLKN